ncbi:hypothetical protein KIM372_03040 [Bombiscardovia nodaiensis]|uniref:FHA domain-containing protein n=1 Tax=Bombiscardovia nodaiensis TaxID=2932181 RepID=A0ABN6SBC5_9BIFI|nr:hypothetical protein KIM372_03040 [Bombiscardovia nodaiensis]
MSDGQRPTQQWVVTINGAEKIRLSPGQSIEIGRKPLRPLADDGMVRLEVQDPGKSMSKRHASFAVGEDGKARLKDLGSTNGSYVVQEDGDLIRLPEDNEYVLQHSAERFQFGDVLVDFAQVQEPSEEAADQSSDEVPDLFAYAKDEDQAAQEPDEANLSVDDILDLRAGEPTGIFHAERVRSRISALHDQVVEQHQEQPETPVEAEESEEQAPVQEAASDERAAAANKEEQIDEARQEEAEDQLQFEPLGAAELQREQAEQEEARQEAQTTGELDQQAFKPAFEPGSVFEKVSQGDFANDNQTIEVDGMTSEDAKNTTDFSLQFEMAKHSQLLPFLAMNPSLYDDLYAWLSAQGNADVDSALEKNEGYREYLAAAQE